MSDQLARKIRTARKPYTCDYCGQQIAKGEEYEWSKHIYDGIIFVWRNHLACGCVASAIWDYCDPDDGMDEDQFQDGCCEVCRRFICPDCPNWNEEFLDCEMDESYCIDRMDEFFQGHELYKAGREAYYEIWKVRERAGEKVNDDR